MNPGEVSLPEILAGRDRRARLQRAWLETHRRPLVSMTLVTPGPRKDTPGTRLLLETGLREVLDLARRRGWPVLASETAAPATGPEALLSVDADALDLKGALVGLERTHPLGRLWDMDVLDPGLGPITRRGLGLPGRRCLLCGEDAHACARSRAHPLEDLQRAVEGILQASPGSAPPAFPKG